MSTSDRFGALLLRFLWALERGNVGLDEFAVGAYLVCAADHETRELAATVTSLAERLSWAKHERTLKRALANLREGDWIDYDVRTGRRPYVITLTGPPTRLSGRRSDARG
jgi:hypothetical protein